MYLPSAGAKRSRLASRGSTVGSAGGSGRHGTMGQSQSHPERRPRSKRTAQMTSVMTTPALFFLWQMHAYGWCVDMMTTESRGHEKLAGMALKAHL